MKKIAYVVGGLWRQHPGLHAKVLGAAQVWEQMGATVSIVLFSEGRVVDAYGNTVSEESTERIEKLGSYYDTTLSKFVRFLGVRNQYLFLKEMLAKLAPDVVYSRYAMPVPGIRRAFGSSCPYIIEINSDDLVEYGLKSYVTGFYNQIFRKSFLNGAAGLVFVSNELESSTSFSWYRGKREVVANSINCSSYPFTVDTCNTRVNICFIGSPKQSWHGLDKIHTLSCHFPEWVFHIIGPSKSEYLAGGAEAIPNVVFHGYLSGKDAKQLLTTMDVGISTLALHRKKMHEASPLKSRQYLAQGIPFISGYVDTSIEQSDFVCQLGNNEMAVSDNLKMIGKFVQRVFRNNSVRHEARQFAETELDSAIIEKKRLEFIVSCI